MSQSNSSIKGDLVPRLMRVKLKNGEKLVFASGIVLGVKSGGGEEQFGALTPNERIVTGSTYFRRNKPSSMQVLVKPQGMNDSVIMSILPRYLRYNCLI